MGSHSYIKLIVDEDITPQDAKLWLDTARAALPSGIVAETEIIVNGKKKSTDLYKTKQNGSWNYTIPLSRDAEPLEVQAVTVAWHRAWPEGDFEIDYSNTGSAGTFKKAVQETALREVAYEAAKLSHNAWLVEMVEQGWRYGTKFDPRGRQNPNLLPWDQLNKKYQLREMKRVETLLEILHNLNLRLVRR